MSGGNSNVVTSLVCPLIGMILVIIMWCIPMPAVLAARKAGTLGSLNPLPWAVILINSLGWTAYGVMLRDYYIFITNATGVAFGMYYVISAVSLLGNTKYNNNNNNSNSGSSSSNSDTDELRKAAVFSHSILEAVVVGGTCFWLTMAFAVGVITNGTEQGTFAVGMGGCIFTMFYYAAPISTMREVVRTKDSSSLYKPALLASVVASAMWFFYGLLGIKNVLVWLPNLVGTILSVSNLVVSFMYPNKDALARKGSSGNNDLSKRLEEDVEHVSGNSNSNSNSNSSSNSNGRTTSKI